MQATQDPKAPFAGCHAVILAGGSGTRLWPLSRTLLPKQLLSLDGGQTLLKRTVARALGAFDPSGVWVVTNEEHVFEVRSQLRELGPDLERGALAEPMGRNTLAAIMLALDRIVEQDPDALAAVFPSDHMIEPADGWRETLAKALPLAREGRLVTFGIRPAKPETGYGYIRTGQPLGEGAFEVRSFVEKPGQEQAQAYVESGEYYWNSGMFVFPVRLFLETVRDKQPVFWEWWETRSGAGLAAGYGLLPDISVDYAVVEKMERIAVVEARFDWDDLGNWEAIHRLGAKDARGNSVQGDVMALDCEGSLLISQGGKLACVGLKDMIAVQTRDATLVCPLSEAQKVKDVVGALKGEGSQLVNAHVTVRRPWGSYTVLEEGPHYKIKRIQVPSGGKLSLQMHHHRSEHWVVVTGTALVEVDGKEMLLTENQSVDIPKTATHRLSNPGKVPVEIIEIQTGPYLEEDDIVRFEDVYGRKAKP
ncbi:Alginate biosynthesis protein AlgA [Fundidesulfovibrio magnetotacticus]|uniref:mannose-1-phosphate guanylyltransferase n=1 Tax=Fundidesulfovibrio magnetotacticus TaxID=2730080 RepID=A0A6V8LWR5_9BACT|nr:mannose-1-phosphate guanylyltransferase/mannose-6-phosphate isomerase [Fundidesulfovibrio magnetotacticus]GFK95031.1 Alginate biosynthesis protein AlgA [Fundidesulfovibrio magnetotacticus]